MVPICTEWWCTEANEATQTHCYTLSGHIMHTDDNADAKRILLASLPADWRKQLGRPHIAWLSTVQQDLKQHHLTFPEAANLAQNRPLWRMMSTYGALWMMMSTYGATQSWVACCQKRRWRRFPPRLCILPQTNQHYIRLFLHNANTRKSAVRGTAIIPSPGIQTLLSVLEVNETACSGVTVKKQFQHFLVPDLDLWLDQNVAGDKETDEEYFGIFL